MSNEHQTTQHPTDELTPEQKEQYDEMMTKLKSLGNSMLGFLGLSTDNFNVSQDPSTGGYSISFIPNQE